MLLNPIDLLGQVIPAAVILIPYELVAVTVAALGYAAVRYAALLAAYAAAPRRHRLADRTEPFRDWADIAAERMSESRNRVQLWPVEEIEYDPLDHQIPLEEVERRMALLDVAGHDDHMDDTDTTCDLALVAQ